MGPSGPEVVHTVLAVSAIVTTGVSTVSAIVTTGVLTVSAVSVTTGVFTVSAFSAALTTGVLTVAVASVVSVIALRPPSGARTAGRGGR
ncbi:hypothetical protein GCM10010305_39660 [Streptomyces termitum]|uniref:Uncharacterized protein n=1 Tax=Streptomyces termitum TaxID=67368 RepID=A0A918T4J2_9ACTN|nr:hypothetical protein GCM10010305_39660 [Streptomyces termitum]